MKKVKSLSKSKIVAYRQCPKRLWLEVHQPELREDSSATEATFRRGYQIGDLAQELYDDGNGELVDLDKLSFGEAFELSAELLQKNQIIFEAGLQAGGGLAFADVMLPLNKKGKPKWKMIEVKSSTSVKDYYRDDVAMQCYVAKEMGVDIKKVALAHVDSSWVYPGDGKYDGLLTEADLTEEALSRYDEAKQWVEDAHHICRQKSAPQIDIGNHCSQPFDCGFYHFCSKDLPEVEHPASWLPDVRSKKLKELIYEDGVMALEEIPDDLLNDKQLRVKQSTLNNETYFDEQAAKEALSPQAYPAYFLDFETANFVIPIWAGTRPYQQVPFQFSLHVLDQSHQLTHVEFLEISGNNPCKNFAEALITYCGKKGPIYVYNRGFEGRIVRELSEMFPKLSKQLIAITARFVDLLPVARNNFYHPSQKGSWSIKSVLPAVGGPDYSDLDGIQDGGSASEEYVWSIKGECSEEEKQKIRDQLLKYCELDTEGMIWVWEKFSGQKINKAIKEKISVVNEHA